MNLSELKCDEAGVVVKIEDCSDRVMKRLSDLGIQKGLTIVALQNSPLGGVKSYQLSHGVFALEDFLAKKIHIEKVSP